MGSFLVSMATLLEKGLLSLFVVCVIKGETQERMSSLHSTLMDSYSTNVVPRNNEEPINVNISFYLMSLIRFDETEETLVTAAWLSMAWHDEFLRWDVDPEFENITDIYLQQKEIWKPDVVLINTVEDYENLGSDKRLVEVTIDGEVLWEPGHRFKTACSPNINKYPFDTQECSFLFSTWTHVDSVVMLTSDYDEIILDDFQENGEWQLISSTARCRIFDNGDYRLSQFIVTLKLYRRRTYYILTVCVPIIILSVLNCLVYLLPPNSGEKMSFCLTTLLAYLVYISFLSDNLPRTSKTTSYLMIYMSLMIGLSFLSVFNSVIVLLFWHKAVPVDEDNSADLQVKVDAKKDGTENDKMKETVNVKDNALTEKSLNKRFFFKTKVCPLLDDKERDPENKGGISVAKKQMTNKKTLALRLDKILFLSVCITTAIAMFVVMVILLSS